MRIAAVFVRCLFPVSLIADGAGTGIQQYSERHCGHGEVMSILQAIEPNFQYVATTPAETRRGEIPSAQDLTWRLGYG